MAEAEVLDVVEDAVAEDAVVEDAVAEEGEIRESGERERCLDRDTTVSRPTPSACSPNSNCCHSPFLLGKKGTGKELPDAREEGLHVALMTEKGGTSAEEGIPV
jgi:hypothetical protein